MRDDDGNDRGRGRGEASSGTPAETSVLQRGGFKVQYAVVAAD